MAKPPDDTTAFFGFEDKLWAAADVVRNTMDPAEYKHVVLGLVFLNTPRTPSRSGARNSSQTGTPTRWRDAPSTPPRMPSRCRPPRAGRTSVGCATQPTIGKVLDDAMDAVEPGNPTLKGALPQAAFGLPALDSE